MVAFEYTLQKFVRDRRGATAIEYGMAAAFIAVAIVGGAGAINTTLKQETYAGLGDAFKQVAAVGLGIKSANDLRQPVDTIVTGSTDGSSPKAKPAERTPNAETEEEDAPADLGPPIYTISKATSSCSSKDPRAGCGTDFNSPVFEGWKKTIIE